MKKLDLNALRTVSGGRCAPVAPPAPTSHGHFGGGGGGGSLLSVNARVS
jgi:hypothetical protein